MSWSLPHELSGTPAPRGVVAVIQSRGLELALGAVVSLSLLRGPAVDRIGCVPIGQLRSCGGRRASDELLCWGKSPAAWTATTSLPRHSALSTMSNAVSL